MDGMATRFKRHKVTWRWDGEEGRHILVGVPKTKSAHMLNPVGAKIFSLCNGEHDVEEITRTLEEQYPEAEQRIPGDVLRFVEYLKRLDLIEEIV